jgi:DNA-binding transcriptional LysR family regulator
MMTFPNFMHSTEQIEIIVRTAECGSIARAASALGIRTADARDLLKKFEDDLGHRLFVRSIFGMRATKEGEAFLEYYNNRLREGKGLDDPCLGDEAAE